MNKPHIRLLNEYEKKSREQYTHVASYKLPHMTFYSYGSSAEDAHYSLKAYFHMRGYNPIYYGFK